MITNNNRYDFRGLSTDVKPTEVGINSTFIEMDTSKKYVFNGLRWLRWGAGSGSTVVYDHFITLSERDVEIEFNLLTEIPVTFTNINSIISFVKQNNLRKTYIANGIYRRDDVNYPVLNIKFGVGLWSSEASYSYDSGLTKSIEMYSRGLSNVTTVNDTPNEIIISTGGSGSSVIANPELIGDEDDLTGLEVDGVKYKVPTGGSTIMVRNYADNEWSEKTWEGLRSFHGSYIWTDGENIYYSWGWKEQYILDKLTSTWNAKIWSGFNNFYGSYIWTDGENVYYSDWSDQYVLDKSTLKWVQKTWKGTNCFTAECIWTDGDNIYYSSYSDQYVLDKSTSTWSPKTWTGLTDFRGENVWTDGENIYYSNGTTQYVLDKYTFTWTQKNWIELNNFYAKHIWKDGGTVYYSDASNQYILDKSTSTWSKKTWRGIARGRNIRGNDIWTDGEHIYYSDISWQYVLDRTSTHTATILAKVAETGDYNDLTNTPYGIDISSEDITDYFEEYCDINASVTEEPIIEDETINILNLDNVDIEIDKTSKGAYQALNLNADNVLVENKILNID